MDHRCPCCKADLGRRKLSQAIIARMEMDCPHCLNRIRLNVHPAETFVVLLNFGTVLVLAALAWGYQSQGFVLATLAAAMASLLALPLLEKTFLRRWPRYAAMARRPRT